MALGKSIASLVWQMPLWHWPSIRLKTITMSHSRCIVSGQKCQEEVDLDSDEMHVTMTRCND